MYLFFTNPAPRRSAFQTLAILTIVAMIGWVIVPSAIAQNETNPLKERHKWTGDFEEILDRRQLRVLVVYNKLLYFLDGPQQRGVSYDVMQEFAKFIDEKYDLKTRKFNVVYIPVSRDHLIPLLNEGYGDVIVANMTITPERKQLVDFSDPLHKDVQELLVTGPSAPDIQGLEDLSGQSLYVRESSSYYSTALGLNKQLENNGLAPINLIAGHEYLEDSDLLEMVSAGLLPMVVVDSHKADFWTDIFDDLQVHADMPLSVGNAIAWAFRKNSPTLESVFNQFVKDHKKGTLLGNIILKRYLKENRWVRNPNSAEDRERFNAVMDHFRKYGEQYEMDWLKTIALGYQESRLDQTVRSPVGAVGVMQMLPSTSKDPNVDILEIEDLEKNIHAGTKYLRFLGDHYFSDIDDDLNRVLLTFAAYNAGPNKMKRMQKETREAGLDPNVWFGNVEHIVAKRIGRETVQYVSNIYKYYIAYNFTIARHMEREAAKEEVKKALE